MNKTQGYIFNWPLVLAILFCFLFWFLVISAIVRAEDISTASYYTYRSCVREGTSGVWTASGERFDENSLTCAMRRRDWGARFKVTNLANGKSVIVRLNDFGPAKKLHAKGRIVDLSKAAFAKISDLKLGVIRVKIEEINRGVGTGSI